jgi:SAM-dependent methyltransferase
MVNPRAILSRRSPVEDAGSVRAVSITDNEAMNEYELIKESQLFDEYWYLEKYGQQVASTSDPINHYLEAGANEGRRPHPLFDVEWYLTANSDARSYELSPLGHYITIGAQRGASPHPLFDPEWYRRQDPRLERFMGNLFHHFLSIGAIEGRSPHPLFDARKYLQDDPDLRAARINPLTHFVECGAAEGRCPSPFFDVKWYQHEYWRLLGSETNPLVHFIRAGAEHGCRPHPQIDLSQYRELCAEAPRDALGAFIHLVETGGKQFHLYSLSDSDSALASELAKALVDRVLGLVPEGDRGLQTAAVSNRVRKLTGKLYLDVSPPMRQAPDFEAAYEYAFARTRNGCSTHLELGTYNVWPDERVAHYVADHEIGDFIRLDFDLAMKPDICASATALPFADESIDRVSSTALFEHVAFPHDIIREAFRVLRPGGFLFIVVPFHFVQHGCPQDYLRYTDQFFKEVCEAAGFSEVLTDSMSCSGVYYTTHQLLKGAAIEAGSEYPGRRAAQVGHLAVMALMGMMQGFDDYFVDGGRAHYHSVHALAIKPGDYRPPSQKPDRSLPFLARSPQLICPVSGLPVTRRGDELVALDGSHRYRIVNGVPEMVALHGFGSSFMRRASSRAALEKWQQDNRS